MKYLEYYAWLPSVVVYDREIENYYLGFGLTGEVGELDSVFAKQFRDKVNLNDKIIDELSDVLWFCVAIQRYYDLFESPTDSPSKLNQYIKKMKYDNFNSRQSVSLLTTQMLSDAIKIKNALLYLSKDSIIIKTIVNYRIQKIMKTLAVVSSYYAITLEELFWYNHNKLESRKAKNTLHDIGRKEK